MDTVDVIGAMEEELAGLRAVCTSDPRHATIRMHRAGVGKVNGTLAAARAVHHGAQSIIVVGTAGALAPELRIGDVVIVDHAVQHDVDASPVGFPRGTIPFEPESVWRADATLVRIAADAVHELGYPTIVGGICSGERFITDDTERVWLRAHFGGACADMETGAIAHACAKLGVPWASVRIISDGANHDAAVDFATALALASERIAHIVPIIAKRLASQM